jgi:hypothetical protein
MSCRRGPDERAAFARAQGSSIGVARALERLAAARDAEVELLAGRADRVLDSSQ